MFLMMTFSESIFITCIVLLGVKPKDHSCPSTSLLICSEEILALDFGFNLSKGLSAEMPFVGIGEPCGSVAVSYTHLTLPTIYSV